MVPRLLVQRAVVPLSILPASLTDSSPGSSGFPAAEAFGKAPLPYGTGGEIAGRKVNAEYRMTTANVLKSKSKF
jgi:hypothetical protein